MAISHEHMRNENEQVVGLAEDLPELAGAG